jgi:translation elongation factor EF-4
MRSTRQAQVGDTLFHHNQSKDPTAMPAPLPGFEKAKAMLYARWVGD